MSPADLLAPPSARAASGTDLSDVPGRALTAAVLALAALPVLANATIAPSLPGLADAFSEVPRIETLAALVLSLPSLAVVLTAALFGIAADRLDQRKLLVTVLLAYALGGTSGALAQTMPQILAGRLILGIGVAGTLTLATQMAADHWQGSDRARLMGWQGAAISAVGIASLIAGGALAEWSWRAPFAIYLAALPLAAFAWMVVPRGTGGSQTPPTGTGGDDGGLPFPWAVLAVTGGVLFAVMVFMFLAATRLPFLLSKIGVTSPGLIGATLALMTVASFPGGVFYGRVRARAEPQAIAAVALGLMAAGYAVISQADALPVVTLGILVTGSGLGLVIPNQTVWLMAHVPASARGRAAGLMTMLLFAGQFVSPLISGVLLGWMDLPGVFLAFAFALGAIALALAFAGVARWTSQKESAL